MKQPAVLVVEDDPECHRWLCRCLQVDYHVLGASLLAGAYNLLGEDNAYFDVVILDRVLPDGDGLELLNFLRVHFPSTRILVLSTRDEAAERVRGLTAGADAYLPKPVSPAEVVAHVQTLLRRGRVQIDGCLRSGSVAYYPHSRILEHEAAETKLTSREGRFLHEFLMSPKLQVSKQQLFELYWQEGKEVETSALHVTIQRLRRKLEQIHLSIHTHYGLGYQLISTHKEKEPV